MSLNFIFFFTFLSNFMKLDKLTVEAIMTSFLVHFGYKLGNNLYLVCSLRWRILSQNGHLQITCWGVLFFHNRGHLLRTTVYKVIFLILASFRFKFLEKPDFLTKNRVFTLKIHFFLIFSRIFLGDNGRICLIDIFLRLFF